MKKPIFMLLLSVVVTSAHAVGTDFRALFLKALNSPNGKARAEVTGPVADDIRAKTGKSNAKVFVDVTTLNNLEQEGCKRMKATFSMPGTTFPVKEGGQSPLALNMELNMCPNGQPPGGL